MILAMDEDIDVRATVALNPAIADLPDVYGQLSRSTDGEIIENFFWNRALVEEALKQRNP